MIQQLNDFDKLAKYFLRDDPGKFFNENFELIEIVDESSSSDEMETE